MIKFKLNGQHRSRLVTFAQSKIECPGKDQQGIDDLESKVSSILISELKARYPDNVLKVLSDFNLLTTTRDVTVYFKPTFKESFKTVVNIHLNEEVTVASGISIALKSPNDGDLFIAYNKFNNAKYSQTTGQAEKLSDYVELIATATYFEDVADVWEEANEIKDELRAMCSYSDVPIVSNLSASRVERIKADVKSRKT